MEKIKHLHEPVGLNSIDFSYKGLLNVDLVDSVLELVFEKLLQCEKNVRVRKRVYHVCVELLQNQCRYIEEAETPPDREFHPSYAFFDIITNNDTYYVTTGNYVCGERRDHLEHCLNSINNKDINELDETYNEVLKNNSFNEHGGAGLGLLDIARKTDKEITYSIDPVNDQQNFFSIKVTIQK